MSFNISSLAIKDTTKIQLRDPVTDELLFADEAKTQPIAINVYGPGSKIYRQALLNMQNRQLKRNKKGMSAELLREEATELLVAVSSSAENFDYNGEALTSKEVWTKLYDDTGLIWVRDQVEAGQGDLANFTKS